MPTRPTRFAALLAILVACLGLGAAVGHRAGAAAPPDSTAADPIKGKVVYEKNCTNCHKSDGTGGVKTVPTANAARNFRDPVFWKGRTDAQVRVAIENGFPKSGMLSYKGVISPADIRNVTAYVRARYQPKGVAPAPTSKTK